MFANFDAKFGNCMGLSDSIVEIPHLHECSSWLMETPLLALATLQCKPSSANLIQC